MKMISNLLLSIFMIQRITSEQEFIKIFNRRNESLIYEAMMQILELKTEYDTVLIQIRGINPSLEWLKRVQKKAPVILNRNKVNLFDVLKDPDYTEKIDAIFFFINNRESVELTLHRLRGIIMKNVMTPVYMVNLKNTNSCKFATNALQAAGSYGILTSYFLCSYKKSIIKIYTYNPFTNRAPDSWNQLHGIEFENANWTLYEREYIKGQKLNEFNFDRMKDLNGYQVTAACRTVSTSYAGKYLDENTFFKNEDLFYPDALRFIDTLPLVLNISFKIYIHQERTNDEKYIESLNEFEKDIFKNSSADILLIPRQIYTNRMFKTLYPIQASQFAIVSYHKGYQTLIEKIYSFYGTWTFLNTISLLIIIFMFIWFNEKKNIAYIMFEILRLIISNALRTPMNSLSRRIFFGTVLLYFLIIQAVFNGHLAKFLTKPQLRKQIDTLKDLEYFGYGTLENESFRESVREMFPEERNNDNICVNSVLDKEADFCVGDFLTLYMDLKCDSGLYISKKSFGIIYWLYSVRENWPLIDHFNRAIIKLWDLGFQKHWESLKVQWFVHNYTVAEERSRRDYQPIKLENLNLIFILFVFGTVFSTLSFGVELCLGRKLKVQQENIKKSLKTNFY